MITRLTGPLLALSLLASTSSATTLVFEAENLSRTSSGATTQVDTEAGFSGGRAVKLNGVAVGNWVEFTLPDVPAGTYTMVLTCKTFPTRGQIQGSADAVDTVTVDQYAATATYNNDVYIGQHAFDGTSTLRFTVVGQNQASSGFTASFDKITLISTEEGTPIYLDPSQPLESRIADLLPRLTRDQKTGQLFTGAPAIAALQIPAMNGWNQSLHGVVWDHPTTMFPVSIAMGATWDPWSPFSELR